MAKARSYTLGDRRVSFIDMKALLNEYQEYIRAELGKQSEANATIRWALTEAGKMWISVFLPKRFEEGYAKTFLHYHANTSYEAYKVRMSQGGGFASFTRDHAGFEPAGGHSLGVAVESPQPQPYVFSGRSKAGAIGSAYPVAFVTSGSARLVIKVELGSIAFHNAESFTFVPFHEYARVLEYAGAILENEILPDLHTGTLSKDVRTFTNPRNAAQFQERLSPAATQERAG